MTDDDLKKQVERNCREVAYLSKELNTEDMKFVMLERRYQQVEDYCFFRKYSRMKAMIEEATSDCLTASYSNTGTRNSISSHYLLNKYGGS